MKQSYCRIVLLLHIITFFLATHTFAQAPKREFRAAWIATVANIDWPSKPGLPAQDQQQEFIHRLDQLKELGCNVAIVQIRPVADALYPSSIEPWCHYLTGRQGQPPFPYYDPLQFMIEETHKRNMEFHAWFNPFRALMDSKKNLNPRSHVTFQHPDWIISYGGKSLIDPGNPDARAYVLKVIMDVVKRYDIDAVHLDDYFYPYRIAGKEFGDYSSYSRYGQGMSKDDWRRNNITLFISQLNAEIKAQKPYVQLGISPFGVWRNSSRDPDGSPTHAGQTDYDDLYADVLLWLRKGYIDYLLPQLYWEHNHHAAAFNALLPWWAAHTYGRHVYYGLGVYRMINAYSGPWAGTGEIMSQLRDIRHYPNSGYAFYSASCFDKLRVPIRDSITYHANATLAMPPAMRWLDSIAPAAPQLKAIPSAQGTLLQWQHSNPSRELIHYAVYRFTNGEAINLDRADRIIAILGKEEFLDANANRYRKSTYVVTALDRLWNESRPSNAASTSADQ